MKVIIISPGKKHDHTVKEGIEEYEKRLKALSPKWVFPAVGTKESEGAAIEKLIKKTDKVILLDERGKDIDTPAFAKLLEKEIQSGTKQLVFIIGGAYGVSSGIQERADMTLRLSSLVFPHMLARLILVEQLYRAASIIEGGKYHHA